MFFSEDYLKGIGNLLEANSIDFKKITREVREEANKDVKKVTTPLKQTMYKIYSRRPEDMISELPTLSIFIRQIITIGIPCAINPFFGIFTYLVDKLIQTKADAKYINLYISNYKRQQLKMDIEIDKETDPEKKEALMKVKKDIDTSLQKLDDYKYELDKYKDEDEGFSKKYLKSNESSNLLDTQYTMFTESIQYLTEEQFNILFRFDNELLSERPAIVSTIKHYKNKVDSKIDNVDTKFDKYVQDLRQDCKNGVRDTVVENRIIPKFKTIIRGAVVAGVAFAINPAIAAISVVVTYTIQKVRNAGAKKKLLQELNQELEMVDEKIKDADSQGDKKRKYELMRLKHKLQNETDRLKGYI